MQAWKARMHLPAFARPPGPRMHEPRSVLQCFGAFFIRWAIFPPRRLFLFFRFAPRSQGMPGQYFGRPRSASMPKSVRWPPGSGQIRGKRSAAEAVFGSL